MFPIPAASVLHFILETGGIMLALFYYRRLRSSKKDVVSEEYRLMLLIAATFGAFFGSRLLGSLENPADFLAGGGEAGYLYYFRSKTIVGGLLGGLWSVELTKQWLGVRSRTGDVYVFPLLLAMMIGRIGCFLMGVGEPTYGLPTDAWLGLDLGDGIPRHATALYEIVFLGFLWIGLRYLPSLISLRPGRLFMLFLASYLLYRFFIGFLQPRVLIEGLGAIQWACLLGLVWYLIDEYWARSQVVTELAERVPGTEKKS